MHLQSTERKARTVSRVMAEHTLFRDLPESGGRLHSRSRREEVCSAQQVCDRSTSISGGLCQPGLARGGCLPRLKETMHF